MTGPTAFVAALLIHAAGPGHPLVGLELDPCLPVHAMQVRRIVGIELDAELAEAAGPDITRARAGCDGDLAQLRVDDPLTGKSLERSIDLAALDPKARSRLLALAIAELVSASWTELAIEPPVPPVNAQASPEAKEVVRKRVEAAGLRWPGTRLVAMGSARASPTRPNWGGSLALIFEAGPRFGGEIDAAGFYGVTGTPIGSVVVTELGFGASLFAHAEWTHFGGRVGLGVRGGPVWLTGVPYSPTAVTGGSVSGLWGGPFATAGLSVPLASRFTLELAGELGFVTRPVVGLVSDAAPVSSDGPWGTVSAGIGWGL